jgi:photosystem II stability/assembly factor-like uncharacterized protein
LSKRVNSGNRSRHAISVLGMIVALSGCEAKLDMSGVETAKEASTARYDHYQSAAASSVATVVIANRGTVLVSTDDGQNWQRQTLPGETATSYPTLVDVEVCPDNRFLALDADRKIWISDETATNWTSKPISTEEEVLDLTCDPEGNFWVVGSFTLILQSTDGGESWEDKSVFEDAMFSKIEFVDSENGFVTGEFGTVLGTRDGGVTWEPRSYLPNEFYPMAALFVSPEQGWVGGLQGFVFQTMDGGQTWNRQDTGTVAPIFNIFEANGSVFAIGEQGTILTLSDEKWQAFDAQAGFGYLRAATPVTDKSFLVAGGGGLIRILDQQN